MSISFSDQFVKISDIDIDFCNIKYSGDIEEGFCANTMFVLFLIVFGKNIFWIFWRRNRNEMDISPLLVENKDWRKCFLLLLSQTQSVTFTRKLITEPFLLRLCLVIHQFFENDIFTKIVFGSEKSVFDNNNNFQKKVNNGTFSSPSLSERRNRSV